MKMNDLTFTEEMIMMVIWSLGSAYLKEIMEAHPEPKPHQNTVSTYLKILQEKKFIKAEREGRIFKYSVEIPYEDYKTDLVQNLLEKHFNNSGSELVKKLIFDNVLKLENLKSIFNEKTSESPTEENRENKEDAISDYIKKLTEPKKKNKKEKKKKKKKK